jgi:hypothetical protein
MSSLPEGLSVGSILLEPEEELRLTGFLFLTRLEIGLRRLLGNGVGHGLVSETTVDLESRSRSTHTLTLRPALGGVC